MKDDLLPKNKFKKFIESLKNKKEFLELCTQFHKYENRDLIYVLARHLLNIGRLKNLHRVGAVEMLFMIWNMAWFQKMRKKQKESLEQDFSELLNYYDKKQIKSKDIFSLNQNDKTKIINLFRKLENKLRPVGAAKTLHILSPEIFPIWDHKICLNYHSYYHKGKHKGPAKSAECYFQFCLDSREILLALTERERNELREQHHQYLKKKGVIGEFPDFKESLLKMLDECNYVKITEGLRKNK